MISTEHALIARFVRATTEDLLLELLAFLLYEVDSALALLSQTNVSDLFKLGLHDREFLEGEPIGLEESLLVGRLVDHLLRRRPHSDELLHKVRIT